MSKTARCTETERRAVVARGFEAGGIRSGCQWEQFQVDEDVVVTGFCKITLKTTELCASSG